MILTEKLIRDHTLAREEYARLLEASGDPEVRSMLSREAVRLRKLYYEDKVFTRGLIEFTNYCKNN